MTEPWVDWLTASRFRIRVAPAAAEKLGRLPLETQERLRQMLQDISELADLVPPATGRSWMTGVGETLLRLRMGKMDVRYSLSHESRTLTIEHVIVPDKATGFGSTG